MTSPIYARYKDGHLEGIGSGIFVTHGGRAFVVTASLVLGNYIDTNELLIRGRSTVSDIQLGQSGTGET
jgi:hypothetical protein